MQITYILGSCQNIETRHLIGCQVLSQSGATFQEAQNMLSFRRQLTQQTNKQSLTALWLISYTLPFSKTVRNYDSFTIENSFTTDKSFNMDMGFIDDR
jgi:hypothetical protein